MLRKLFGMGKKRAGGSAASDAVEALVDPKTWPVLDDRFSNAVEGGGARRHKKRGGSCGDSPEMDMEGGGSKRLYKKRGGSCSEPVDMGGGGSKRLYKRRGGSCSAPVDMGGGSCGHMEGGGCSCSKASGGGSVPASMPIGSNPYAPLNKHSVEASYNAAAPNVETFPKSQSNKYGVPASSMASSGGAKKPKASAKKPASKKSKASAKKPASKKPASKKPASKKPASKKPASKKPKKPSAKKVSK
jgi:hypothetical protein